MQDRKEPRLTVELPVTISEDSIERKGTATSLSLSGARVVSSSPVAPGTPLRLSVYLPDDNKPVDVELATVRWSQDGHFGLSAVVLGEESRDRLQRFLDKNFQLDTVVLQTRAEPNNGVFDNGNSNPSTPRKHIGPGSLVQKDEPSPVTSQEGGAQRRQLKRVHVESPIRLVGDLMDKKGVVVDLSTGGCGIQIETCLKDVKYLGLVLSHPQSDVPIKIELAAVRWVGDQQAGFEFIRMSPVQKKRLGQLITTLEMLPSVHRD